uniref:ERO1-like protein alpha n=1 Tax=Cyclopterus lumpus TaxID=8103 RepID=A0A8C2WV45_CYCLU
TPPPFNITVLVLRPDPVPRPLQVSGDLDDCSCDVETIDSFNERLLPQLQVLLEEDYFRFYKVGAHTHTHIYTDTHTHTYIYRHTHTHIYTDTHTQIYIHTVTTRLKEVLLDWSEHGDGEKRFCVVDDDESPDSQYVDLLLNPERFTGYRGPESWRIWTSIYEENCFKPPGVKRPVAPTSFRGGSGSEGKVFYSWLEGQCVEKRAFYRLISGLHASISIHLSARYLLEDRWFQRQWGHNVSEFRRRFDSALTGGEGPERLRSLYFLFLVELRALAKALPVVQRPSFRLFTGRPEEDRRLKELLLHVLQLARSFPLHFDETSLFTGDEQEAATLKEDVRRAFLNISRVMDCVGCFRCRLWGKLQTQGLGTSLKILFSERQIEAPPLSRGQRPRFRLGRQEVVSLLNAFGRVSTSISELKTFRALLAEEM